MLSKPVTQIAETFGVLREIDRLTQGIRGGGSGAHRSEIENRKGNH